jgi:hypothetical protein
MTLREHKESDLKYLKNLKMDENDKLRVNLISKETWNKRYISLWRTERNREELIDRTESVQPGENTEEANLDKVSS